MKRTVLFLMVFFLFPPGAPATEPGKTVFGPKQYDVKARYGRENIYRETFASAEGAYVVRLQNGNTAFDRSEFIEFTLNGQNVLKDGRYDQTFIACVSPLQKENSFELVLKDAKPAGLRKPALPPRFVTISVVPLSERVPAGVYAVGSWDGLKETADLLQKISSSESASLAAKSINLRFDPEERAEAMRMLSDRKDASAQPFILQVFKSGYTGPDVRGEAALALGVLGDAKSVPVLMSGVLDPEEKIRMGSSRALSFYPEEQTREPLTKMLLRLDVMRRNAVINAIGSAGWKPVGTLLTLAETTDVQVSETAVRMLGTTGDPRAADLLLRLLREPGRRSVRAIIAALGETRDARAIEPLAAMALDPVKRTGREAELGTALAALGDAKSVDTIADMIRMTQSDRARSQLMKAYRDLTGKEYR